jgi:hypothetical protein
LKSLDPCRTPAFRWALLPKMRRSLTGALAACVAGAGHIEEALAATADVPLRDGVTRRLYGAQTTWCALHLVRAPGSVRQTHHPSPSDAAGLIHICQDSLCGGCCLEKGRPLHRNLLARRQPRCRALTASGRISSRHAIRNASSLILVSKCIRRSVRDRK